jgi:hypothetical protein
VLIELLKEIGSFRQLSGKFAVDAAPYCHARLSAIHVDGKLTHVTEEEDAALRTIEGTLEQIALTTADEPSSPRSLVEDSSVKPNYPILEEPTDIERKLVNMANARRSRVG